MNDADITIMNLPTCKNSRLYYYQGNFYYPLEGVSIELKQRIRFKIAQFKKENAAMFAADRAHPDYKSIVQLFDEQMEKFAGKS